jgi:cytochrome c-type biogenesis protein CcmF
MTAERRFYPLQKVQTNQTGIRTNLISNIYIALGEADSNGGWTVRLYYHPLAPWLWIGGFTMAFGGFVSLSDRRLRVGVPKLKRAAVNARGPAQEVPAT